MKDIELSKALLDEENLTLAIVKDGKAIYKSRDRGIGPLYFAVNEMKENLKGSSVADRVTGRAAAMLYEYAQIKELHTTLISENALSVLDKTPIKYEYLSFAPYIKNRDKTGMCPIENLSLKAKDVSALQESIKIFLESIKR
jgi:hypothetical protein